MEDDMPDIPLENFGGETEVATPPVAPEVAPATTEQTTQTEPQATGSEVQPAAQPTQTTDNPTAAEQPSNGRPERRDRLQERFGELTGTIKQQNAMIEQLNAQLAQNSALAGIPPLKPDENGEVSVQAIQEHNQKVASAIANASASSQVENLRTQLTRESIANRVDSEGAQIETLYKDDFDRNPLLMSNIRNRVEREIQLAGSNVEALKMVKPLEIANEYMESVKAERRLAQAQTAQNLENIQAEGAINPESAPQTVDPNSDAALDARVENIKF